MEEAHRIIKLDCPLQKAGLSPAAGGYLGQMVSKPSTHVPEVVGLTAAVFILLFTLGTVGPTSPTASTDFVDRDFE
jgi:putative drug exporter of the RND superfamily